MAETMVVGVIDKLVQLLSEEEKSFKGVSGEVQSVKLDLEFIRRFVKDAEARSHVTEGVRDWVRQVTEVAQHIDSVMDKYLLQVAQRRRHRQRGGFVSFLRKTGNFIKTLKSGPDIASEIGRIKSSLEEIKSTSARYSFSPSGEGPSSVRVTKFERLEPRFGSRSIEDDEVVVGIDSIRHEIMARLVDGASTLTWISLVGMGGIGKTTLAKHVYECGLIRKHFDCHAWVTVSQSYDMKKLLWVMKRQIHPAADISLVETDTLGEMLVSLREYLEMKRYVVVFDDVWDEKFLELMKHALPDNDKGSRIIVTTRNLSVAATSKITLFSHILRLQPLTAHEAFELFCRKTFHYEFEGRCPRELDTLSHQIVEKCQGLPLLIVAVAGFLSTKEKVALEWKRLLFYFESALNEDSYFGHVLNVLSLSYHDLPHQLQSCFLYFSIFPNYYSISDAKLFRLWIAEGFIKEEADRTLEQVAEGYLNELIQRNLVQISYVNCHGFERLCKVHDLIREMITYWGDGLGFCHILYVKNSWSKGKSRRLSICGSAENILETTEDFNEVRSLFLFDNDDELSGASVATLFERYKLLKIVDFENMHLHYLPHAVGNLLHLKYISLRNTKVKKLPRSVGKLENLETLDLRSTLVKELPVEINKLKKLRELLASAVVEKDNLSSTHGVRIKEGIGCLENLETLMTVEADVGDIKLMKELENLQQLRWLGVSKLTTSVLRALCTSIEKMNHLEGLRLHSHERFDLQSISSPPTFLQHLVLKGRLQKMPDWISRLEYLSVLGLSFSSLGDDPLETLYGLPNLVFLSLYHAFNGEQLHFKEGGFQKLKLLVLRELPGLQLVKIDTEALPLLEELQIGPSRLMDEVPSDIKHLRNLNVLEIYDMPRDFVLGMLPDEGSDHWKVKHIPSIVFRYKAQGGRYTEYKLGELDLLDHLNGLARSNGRWDDRQFSFFYSDDEDLTIALDVGWDDDRLSFFSDDIED